jgi:hypothetical protein
MLGFVVERRDGPHFLSVERGGDGRWGGYEFPITREQERWLRR